MAQLQTHNIDKADETRKSQASAHVDVVTLGTFTLGRETCQPEAATPIKSEATNHGNEKRRVLNARRPLNSASASSANAGTSVI